MRKLFKTAILGVSALALPFIFAATVNAADGESDAEAINTKLEYQVNANNNSMRFISTIELNGRTLDDIVSIDMNFDLTKEGQETKHSKTQTTTTVYESISGDNGKEKVDGTYYAVITITNIDSKSGWRITPTFTYNYEDGSTENVSASSWLIGGTRVYFTNSYNWNNVYAYLYKGGDSNGAWPGESMTSYDAEHGIYYIDYLKIKEYNSIIFSNGESNGKERQTEDLVLDSTTHSYSLGKMNEDRKYEGLASTCSTHKWSSDYVSNGATHYHVCETCGAKSKITDNDMEPVEGEAGVYKDVYSNYRGTKETGYVYVQDSYYGTTDILIYYWGGSVAPTENYPGDKINDNNHYFTTDQWGRNIYKVFIGDSTGFLLNGGGDYAKTSDLNLANGNAIWLDNWQARYYNICENAA